jgi:hypothetical protein
MGDVKDHAVAFLVRTIQEPAQALAHRAQAEEAHAYGTDRGVRNGRFKKSGKLRHSCPAFLDEPAGKKRQKKTSSVTKRFGTRTTVLRFSIICPERAGISTWSLGRLVAAASQGLIPQLLLMKRPVKVKSDEKNARLSPSGWGIYQLAPHLARP